MSLFSPVEMELLEKARAGDQKLRDALGIDVGVLERGGLDLLRAFGRVQRDALLRAGSGANDANEFTPQTGHTDSRSSNRFNEVFGGQQRAAHERSLTNAMAISAVVNSNDRDDRLRKFRRTRDSLIRSRQRESLLSGNAGDSALLSPAQRLYPDVGRGF